MVKDAGADKTITVQMDAFDRDKYLFNCHNGTINLRTGEFRPHTPDDRLTKLTEVDYDPDATCPRWLTFMDEVFEGDKERTKYLQKAVGYAMSGDTRLECMFSIDNYVRFCGTQTIHDAFISRQQKIRAIIKGKKAKDVPVHLHVCWQTTDGNNCCVCEKCIRTIMAFFAEAENPSDYGFTPVREVYRNCVKLCRTAITYNENVIPLWEDIQKAAINNRKKIRESGLEPYIRWIYTADFKKINHRLSRKETFNIVKSKLYKLFNR